MRLRDQFDEGEGFDEDVEEPGEYAEEVDPNLTAEVGVSDMSALPEAPPQAAPPPPAPAGADGFNPDDSTFDERQKNMTAQERADWASKRWGKTTPGEIKSEEPPPPDRTRFEQAVFQQIGGDPFVVDVMKEVDDATRQDLPELFRAVFGGNVIWEDRFRLNKKQNAAWQEEVKRYRAHVKEQIEGKVRHQKEAYKELMGRFDLDQKTKEALEKKKAEKDKAWAERTGKIQEKQGKAMEALQKQDNTLRTAEMRIIQDMARMAAEGVGGKPAPAMMEAFITLQNELAQVRQQREQIKMRTDPGYRQAKMQQQNMDQLDVSRQDVQPAEAAAPAAEPAGDKATADNSAPGTPDEIAKTKKLQVDVDKARALAKKPHPEKGVPVKAQFNKTTGEVKVTFKDGTTEIRK